MKPDAKLVQASILRLAIPDNGGFLRPGPLLTVNSAQFTEVDVSRTNDLAPEDLASARAAPRLHLPHTSVSEKHAKLVWRDGEWCVVDVGSSNGTFVNYKLLEEDVPTPLKENDILRCGYVDVVVSVTPVFDPDAATIEHVIAAAYSNAADAALASAEAAAAVLYQKYIAERRRAVRAAGRRDCRDYEPVTIDHIPGV